MDKLNERICWLAGIVDGEGSIGLKRCTLKRGNKVYLNYAPMISIANNDLRMMDEIRAIFDKLKIKYSFTKRELSKRNKKWKDNYAVSITSYQMGINFLEIVLPYLISKKEQSEILIDFCRDRVNVNHRGQGGKFIKTYQGNEEDFFQKISALNKKGKSKVYYFNNKKYSNG